MTDKEKLEKLMKLADAMYYAAQHLTTDASRLHEAMEEYRQFIIHEYFKEEPVSEDLEEFINTIKRLTSNTALLTFEYGCREGAKWQKQQDQSTIELAEDHAMLAGMEKMKEQMLAKAVEGTARPDDNEIWCNLSTFNFKDGDKCKVILIKED